MRTLGSITVVLLLSAFAWSQTPGKDKDVISSGGDLSVRSSAAYAELLLFRTELQSELESLILEYTEEYPRVAEIRQTLIFVDRDSNRLNRVKTPDSSKLTVALGKLMVRKIQLEVEHWKLQKNYKDEHPEVKRSKRRFEIYESAIAEVLN